ncbi:MAG: plasmid replication/partition related protein [Rhodoferax sp.]|nr:plasmid replication/partition related protein [Rhodoferax sp.]MCB2028590.1 plasmid replication/partition related protein [Rhodoferax sp.]MCB2040488.1 plasmid replication/partition related protein [Rhodoferax sp.]MCP5262354.1 plasmid replication/partition related protein [Rhodoferax sp.]
MPIVVDPQLQAYIDPLTPDEHAALERSLLAEGCRDALVLWGDILVDGHNRYGICRQHDLPFQTVQNPQFQSIEDVHLWMIDQHLGRRSISDFQRGELALRKRAILAERRARMQAAAPVAGVAQPAPQAEPAPQPRPLESREDIAKAARLSSSQVVLIEKIRKQAAPELVAAVKSGTISINAAAAVASLPEDEQKAAALAGRDELKLAAKRVREARRKPAEAAEAAAVQQPSDAASAGDELQSLRARVAALEAENAALRREVQALRDGAGDRLASG